MIRTRVAVFGIAGLAALAIACGGGSDDNVSVTPGDSAGPAASAAPKGPKAAKMGDTITVDASLFGQGDNVVAYTVVKGAPLKAPSEFEEPSNGTFYGVTLTVVVKAGSHYANSSDLSFVAKDGTVYEAGFTTHKGSFQSADLKTGQKKTGLVVFDVPKDAVKGGKIQVKTFWDNEAYGYWTL